MNETDLDTYAPPRKFHFEWVFPIFFRPRRTLKEVTKQETGVWQTPLLILSILAVLAMIMAAGPRQTAAQMGTAILPPNFQYYTPEQQQQFMDAISQAQGPMFMIVFPAVSALIGLWLSWFILGSVLHLVMTLSGSRSSNTASLNLAAWASMPFGVRYIVQSIYYLSTGNLIRATGIAGFVAPEATFLAALLTLVDIYLIWQVILLLLGARPLSGLSRGKAVLAVFASVLIVLGLQALPGFLSAQLGDLSVVRPFMF